MVTQIKHQMVAVIVEKPENPEKRCWKAGRKTHLLLIDKLLKMVYS